MTGVQMTAPPAEFVTEMNESITRFVDATIKADERGGLIAVASTRGVNLVVVQRTGTRSEVVAYIGKQWNKPLEGGIYWRQRW